VTDEPSKIGQEPAAATAETAAGETSAETGGMGAGRFGRLLRGAGPPIAIAVAVLVVARATLQPGVGFWDTAEFQTAGPVLGTLHPTGFPSYAILGWIASIVLLPFGDPAFRMNLLSAVCVAGASGLLVVLVRQLTGRAWLALGIAVIFFTTSITWRISTHADAHAFHLFLLALLLVLLVGWGDRQRAPGGPGAGADRWLLAAAATYAIAVGNHSLALLFAPGIGLYVLAVDPGIWRRVGLVARCVGLFAVLTALVYLELPLRAGPLRAPLVYGTPQTWDGFRYVVLAEQFRSSLGYPFRDIPLKLAGLVDTTVGQLGPLAVLIPLGAIATLARRWRYLLLTLPTLALTCFFAVSYSNADINRYYLGPLLIGLSWAAILVSEIVALLRTALTFAPEGSMAEGAARGRLGAVALELVAVAILLVPTAQAYSDRFRQVDLSHDRAAARWLDAILPQLQRNAVVVSWWSYSTPLWYALDVEGLRSDVTIIDDRTRLDEQLGEVGDVIEHYLGTRPVYLIRTSGDMPGLQARYDLRPLAEPMNSGLVEVIGRRTAVAP
jgi:hypothetical protein